MIGHAMNEARAHLAARRRLVLLVDVPPHRVDPLAALAAVAEQCGDRLGEDVAEWWRPTCAWFAQVLAKLGIRELRLLERFDSLVYPAGHRQPRTVIHARR